MTFMLTASGAEYHFLGQGAFEPNGRPVNVPDIADQLAKINRFHGATKRPYSVAEHSLLVCEIAERNACSPVVCLAALMHDAHEIVTNDLASPAKQGVNATYAHLTGPSDAWRTFEGEHARHFRKRLGLQTTFVTSRERLGLYDLQALATERRDLMRWTAETHAGWAALSDGSQAAIRPIDWISLDTPERTAMPWQDWRDRFTDKYEELCFAIDMRTGGAPA